MELTEYQGVLTGCQCLSLPEGTLLRESFHRAYLDHINVYISEGVSWDAAGYYLCPNTGVVWRTTYLSGGKIEEIGMVRTSCRQTPLDAYTIAKGVVQLYSEPLYPHQEPHESITNCLGASPSTLPPTPPARTLL